MTGAYPFVRTTLMEQKMTIASVGLACKMFLNLFTTLKVGGVSRLNTAIESQRPLITYCNHDSTLDDPLLFGILDLKYLCSFHGRMRWSLGAQEIIFNTKCGGLCNRFFSAGRVIPIIRGNGIYQRGMDHALDILNDKGWINIFPEGRCNLDPRNLLEFKWGISRLILDCREPPLVVPIYHKGLGTVIPVNDYFNIKLFQEVQVEVGEIIDFKDIDTCRMGGDESQKRIEIAKYLRTKLKPHVPNLTASPNI